MPEHEESKGTKRNVTECIRKGMEWHLELECGHKTIRPVKSRLAQDGPWEWALAKMRISSSSPAKIEDPAPKWTYCSECLVK